MKLQTTLNFNSRQTSYSNPFFVNDRSPKLEQIRVLTDIDKTEVLSFLNKRPVKTVVIKSFITDRGLENADNRGVFYGFQNAVGRLEGIALVGHTTLIEAHSEEAIITFAALARSSETPIHLMMADDATSEIFWKHYAAALQTPRLTCTELLFEISFPFLVRECAWDIRLAEKDELDQIAKAHAEVAFVESGVDPLIKDPEGFLNRCLKRIEKGRTFVVFHKGTLAFKADIVAETEDVIYLEGIYVAPEYRGRGIGAECLAKLSSELLNRVSNICLLSNKNLINAHKMFAKAGFQSTDSCQTIFV